MDQYRKFLEAVRHKWKRLLEYWNTVLHGGGYRGNITLDFLQPPIRTGYAAVRGAKFVRDHHVQTHDGFYKVALVVSLVLHKIYRIN